MILINPNNLKLELMLKDAYGYDASYYNILATPEHNEDFCLVDNSPLNSYPNRWDSTRKVRFSKIGFLNMSPEASNWYEIWEIKTVSKSPEIKSETLFMTRDPSWWNDWFTDKAKKEFLTQIF